MAVMAHASSCYTSLNCECAQGHPEKQQFKSSKNIEGGLLVLLSGWMIWEIIAHFHGPFKGKPSCVNQLFSSNVLRFFTHIHTGQELVGGEAPSNVKLHFCFNFKSHFSFIKRQLFSLFLFHEKNPRRIKKLG